MTAVTRFYVEEGATVNAGGVVTPTWCVIDSKRHRQVGESFSTREDAMIAIALIDLARELDRRRHEVAG